MVRIMRIGVLTNFNFTDAEIEEVRRIERNGYKAFVNCNSKTPIRADIPTFVTLNGVPEEFTEPRGKVSNIKAARIKVIKTKRKDVVEGMLKSFQWCLDNGVPALITPMRFRRRETFLNYVAESPPSNRKWREWLKEKGYAYSKSYFRPLDPTWSPPEVAEMEQKGLRLYVCDESGHGCSVCNNCVKLTFGEGELFAVDLKASGYCPYNCPDCFARVALQRTRMKIAWDKPRKVSKMVYH